MKSSVIVFPGSNCDRDVAVALQQVMGNKPEMVWHGDTQLPNTDLVVLPGGFSYGDYLRCGAIANYSPIMAEVRAFAEKGGKVMGICNGFQILIEAGLLPGALIRNRNLKFVCKDVYVRTETTLTPFTLGFQEGQVVKIPLANHDGNYFINDEGLKALEANDQIAFRYCNEAGEVNDLDNPTGSVSNIAGILNETKNVLGLMPHPERLSDAMLGGDDGTLFFKSLMEAA